MSHRKIITAADTEGDPSESLARPPVSSEAGAVAPTLGRFEAEGWLADPLAPPILLVEAGAGYGKTGWCERLYAHAVAAQFTTLLIEVADRSASGGELLPWKRIEADDALRQAIERDHGAPLATHDLDSLAGAAEGLNRRLLIIIDGYDRSGDDRLGQAIADISARQRVGDRIAVTSRKRIDIRFRRRWMDGGATRIAEDMLRLGREAIAARFEQALSNGAIDTLLTWSEGWPLMIEAAHRGWQRKRHRGEAIDVGDLTEELWPDVAAFMTDEILAGLTVSQRELLTRSAFLDMFDDDLVQTLTGKAPVWTVLDELVQQHVLTVSGDKDPLYRCHPLLRRLLEAELRKRGKDFRRLARRAAQMFWQRHDVQRAIHCADLAGDSALAARWVLSLDTTSFGVSRGGRELRDVMQHVPAHILDSKPRLALAHAFLAAKKSQIDLARQIVGHVRAASTASTTPIDRLLARDMAIVEVAIAMYGGRGFDGPVLSAIEMIESVSYGDEGLRGFLENIRCAIAFDASDFPEALARCGNAQYFYTCQGAANGIGYIHLHSGRIHGEMLDSEQASKDYEGARRKFIEAPRDEQSLRLLKPLQARLAYDLGRFEEAQRLCDSFLQEVDQGGYYGDALYIGFRTSAKLSGRRHGILGAQRSFEGALDFAKLSRIGHLEELLLLERAMLDPDADDVAVLLARLECGPGGRASRRLPWRIRDLHAIVLARHEASTRGVEKGISILFDQIAECQEQGRPRSQIDLMVAVSLLLNKAQQRDRAIEMLREAARLSRRGDIVSPFLENGQDVIALLSLLASAEVDGGETRGEGDVFISRILMLQDNAAFGPVTLLSQRERDVLRYLAEGMSNKLIARQLNISPETVRYYLKGIYEKYGLHGGYANRRALAHFVTQSSATEH